MDPLSTALQAIRIERTTYCCSDLGAPWGITFGARPHPTLHVVRSGTCHLRLSPLDAPIALSAGDVVLLPRGDEHTFCKPAQQRSVLVDFETHPSSNRPGPPARWGEGAERTLLVCIEIRLSHDDVSGLIARLPRVIHVRGGDFTGDHLQNTLDALGAEAMVARPGHPLVTRRLIEVLLVQTLRGWLQRDDAQVRGWLAAIEDPKIGEALALIHERPDEPWTIERLARRVGASRSRFCERFTEVVGESPVAYLTRFRMQRAAILLRARAELSVAQIAERAGYDSEAAFNRAFKRVLGVPPGRYRKAGDGGWRASLA
jgi:AraC-like DNA-binding protein